MDFEFDPDKSEANKAKHGIDFVEAQELWHDGKLIVASTGFEAEARWLAIAQLGNKNWTAVFTMRDNVIRIISVRRSRNDEIENYIENYC